MDKANKLLTTGVLAILLLAMVAIVAPAKAQTETVETDKGLYAIIFNDTNVGYVNVTVAMKNLDPTAIYKLVVSKFNGPEYASIEGTFSLGNGTLKFVLPPSKDARPADIAGTWNATLYKKFGATYTKVAFVNFGVWGINAKILNYGRILQVFGGGFNPAASPVTFTVYNKTDSIGITQYLFGETPAKCKVGSLPDATYGRIANSSAPIPKANVKVGTYVVDLGDFSMLPNVKNVYEDKVEFQVTKNLLVKILNPPSNAQFNRTQTINVEAEVLYTDFEPVIAGSVTATLDPPGTAYSPHDKPKTITLTYDPVSKTWKGSWKIRYNNVTALSTDPYWTINVDASDIYGNTGSATSTVRVYRGVLVVSTLRDPAASVPRASWVTWQVRVTFEGDGLAATLNVPYCTAYVVNATTNAIVSSAYIVALPTRGNYNITWFVPSDAPLGTYKFMISKNALQDNVTIIEGPNIGPKAVVFSTPFTVGVTSLKVVADTYGTIHQTATRQKAFTPGSTVNIGANVTYLDSGVVMSSGSVRAYIYNATGSLIAEKVMTLHDMTRMWWCSWDSTGYPAGRYTVVVKARDIGNNIGEGSTYFYLSGLAVTPASGTVPPIECTRIQNLTKTEDEWLVTASIYTDPATGKKLGTTVKIVGAHMTPNSKVNITVDWLPYVEGKILLAMNVPTDSVGSFSASIVFPTTIMGIYEISAKDAKGLEMKAQFEVKPGMILTPDPVVGSALIKVIATGLPGPGGYWYWYGYATAFDLLINGTDALTTLAGQANEYYWSRWYADENGTLKSWPMMEELYSVKPGFLMPINEPGTYKFDLIMHGGTYWNCTSQIREVVFMVMVSDSVKVVNALKQLPAIVTKLDELVTLLKYVNVTLVGVSGNVAILVTDSSIVKADLATLKTMLTGMNATLVSVKDGVATISTTVGKIKATVDALNATIVSVSKDVTTIKTDVGTIKADTATLKTMLTRMNATLVSVSGSVATLSTTVGTIKASVDALSPKIDSVSGSVATVSTTVGTIKSSVDALSAKVTSIEGDVATVKTTLGTLTGKVESIDGNVATVKTDVGTIKAELATVKSTVSDVKDTVSEVPSAVSNVSLAVWIAVVLSLIAAIGSIVSLVMLRKKIA